MQDVQPCDGTCIHNLYRSTHLYHKMAATELDRLVRGRWRMLSGGYDGVVFGASWSCGISWDWVREKRLGSAI